MSDPVEGTYIRSEAIAEGRKLKMDIRTPPIGMTMREYFAGLAMQGLVSGMDPTQWGQITGHAETAADWFASNAVSVADALLAELEM